MRNVLITGGSSGIGRAARRRASGGGAEVEAFEFDLGDLASHRRLVARLPGPVDVLVNNAAVGSSTVERYVDGGDMARAAAFLQINSVGPLWLASQLLPAMLDRGYGKIVNVASVGGGIAVFPGFHVADGGGSRQVSRGGPVLCVGPCSPISRR